MSHGIYNIAGPDCKAPAYLESMKQAKLKPIPNSRRMPPGLVSLPGALKQAGCAAGFIANDPVQKAPGFSSGHTA